MGIRLIKVPMDPVTCRVDLVAVEKAMTSNTIMMYGSAPSFPQVRMLSPSILYTQLVMTQFVRTRYVVTIMMCSPFLFRYRYHLNCYDGRQNCS